MNGNPIRRTLLILTALALAPSAGAEAQAPGSGTVTGRVTGDADRPLAGATVEVQGTTLRVLTNERGDFRIAGVPPGSQTLRVRTVGFRDASTTVEVAADETVRRNVALQVSPFAIEGITVQGQVGQAEALQRQRAAVNIRSIVSSEHVERFPDTNVSDVLRRMPGVAAQDDRGETGLHFLRGLSPSFTSVTIEGQRVPSTTRTDRGTSLSGVPAEMLESMEVVRTVTPDMDADAVAGSIVLRPRRPTTRQLDGRIEGGLHSVAAGGAGRAGITWGDRAGAFGWVVSGDLSRQERGTEALAFDWTNLGSGDVSESMLDRLRLQSYPIERTRASGSTTLDYEFSPASHLFLRGFLSRYDTREERHRITYRLDAGTRVAPGAAEVTRGRVEREGREYLRQRHIYSLTGGGAHPLGALRVDYSLGWNRANRTEPYRDYFEYRQSNVDMRGTAPDRFRPVVEVTNGRDPFDLSTYSMRHFDSRRDDMRDDEVAGILNFELPWTAAFGSGTLRFGGKATQRERSRDYQEWRFDRFDGSFSMAELATPGDHRTIVGTYRMGGVVDWSVAGPWWQQNRDRFDFGENRFRENSDSEDYAARENIAAGYAMATFDVGSLQVLGGARYEHTRNRYSGKRLVFDADGSYQETLPIDGRSSYGDLFPMLHLRYRLDDATNLRFAATRTIARPLFLDLAPNEFIDFSDQRVRRGNPALPPARATNLDVLAERYFASVGLVSGGLFFKDISDFTFVARTRLTDGEFAGFDLFEPQAGDRAQVWGAEVGWQQRLAFLPGALDGLGVFVNYAWTRSSTELGDGAERDLPLPFQVPHVLNAALSYDRWGFSGLLSLNYQGSYIRSVGSTDLLDEFKRHRRQWDFSAHQRLTSGVRAFVQLNNITNEPYIRYIGSVDFPDSSDYHGRWGTLGLRFSF